MGKRWRRVGSGVYAAREAAGEPLIKLQAALLRLPTGAVFSGHSAAFLHGLDSVFPSAIEATLASPTNVSRRAGLRIRRCQLDADEVVLRKGLRVTSALRTVVDLCCLVDLVEAVVYLDSALHKRLVRLDDLKPRPGRRGVARLRRAIELAEPATESPMETRLRLVLVLAGLPRPQVQASLPKVFARADLYYPESRLVIEYDGATHRDTLAADNRRQNRIVEAGYRVLRFTSADVFGEAPAVIAMVRQAL